MRADFPIEQRHTAEPSLEANMTWKSQYEKFLIVAVAVTFFSPNASRLVRGGGGSSLSARSFFQRTVDSPGEGANGTLELKKNGNKQSIQIDVHGLGDESMGIFIGTSTDTNDSSPKPWT